MRHRRKLQPVTTAGDTTTIDCDLWGSTRYAADGCTWTPTYPSVGKVTGTDDLHYHGGVIIVWDVTWTASDGTSGTFAQLPHVHTGDHPGRRNPDNVNDPVCADSDHMKAVTPYW